MEKSYRGYSFKNTEVREQNFYIRKLAHHQDVDCIRIILKDTMQVREYNKYNYKQIIQYLYEEGRRVSSTICIEPVFPEYYKGDTEIEF